ncbi:hypothetical protein E4U14_006635 [Claviceps sp. LM454 group G7]|nr:hypothetical protein E4U14_006635 [Claviceps sp. LM454 group G7]
MTVGGEACALFLAISTRGWSNGTVKSRRYYLLGFIFRDELLDVLTAWDLPSLGSWDSRHKAPRSLFSLPCDGPTLLRTSAFSGAPRLELSSKEYDSHTELICPDSVVALPPEFFAHWIDGLFDVLGLADEFDANVEDAPPMFPISRRSQSP